MAFLFCVRVYFKKSEVNISNLFKMSENKSNSMTYWVENIN